MENDENKRKESSRPRPVLTEKQRIEARRRRQAARRRSHRGNVLSRGMRATGHEIKRAAAFLAGSVAAGLGALAPLGGLVRAGLARAGGALARLAGLAVAAARSGVALAGRGLVALDRLLTPRRALLAVALLGSLLLAASQFTDFRATEIGQPGYAGIEDVATAPRVDVVEPTGSHSVLLLAGALLALGATVGAALTGRRAFALVVAAVGGVTLLTALVVDLPNGLDLGDAELSYSGVSAVLLSGFWLQLAAGAALAAAGLLLQANPAGSAAPDRRRAPSRRPGERDPARRAGRPTTAGGSAT